MPAPGPISAFMPKATTTGTKVSFKPDPTLFTEEKGGMNFVTETLLNRIRELAFLNAGVEIAFEDERVGKREVFKFEKGLEEYVRFLNEGKNALSSVMSPRLWKLRPMPRPMSSQKTIGVASAPITR